MSLRRAHKYNAKRCMVQGVGFDSQKEGSRYLELLLLEKAGEIGALELQPRFDLIALNAAGVGEVIGRMTLDFAYLDKRTNRTTYEDVKSQATKTTAYRLRKRILKANYGIDVTEV